MARIAAGGSGVPQRRCDIPRTAFVSTYPPRRCGIAAFTSDLRRAVGGGEVVALHRPDEPALYPAEVRHRIRHDDRGDYSRAAALLDDSDVEVVSVQHEFGIWGGEAGSFVLDLVRALRKPYVVTLHTVLRHPSPLQQRIVRELTDRAATSIVMSQSAAALLAQGQPAGMRNVEVVPHGVPDLPLRDPATMKPRLHLGPEPLILSFGLLGRGKGYEQVIEAMPAVVAEIPEARYFVLGATHPGMLRDEGEAYRHSLQSLAADLGVADRVAFVDKFVSQEELGDWLMAADVFVTPYPNLEQIVSGTLSYAMGAGKAIVSTPYAYAAEMLRDGRGRLVPPGSPAALATAFVEILRDEWLRRSLGLMAYRHGREMIWSRVGERYRHILERVARVPARPEMSPLDSAGVANG